MKNFIIVATIMLSAWNCFPQLNIVDSKPAQSTITNSQSNIITIKLPFTAISGNNNLVDNYLCYNGQYYYLNAKKTTNSSDKSVSFILGSTRNSAVETLNDLLIWLANNTIGSTITVEMGGTKHTITKKEDDILSCTTSGITGAWLLDEGQILMSMRQLTQIPSSQNAMFKDGRGGSGSGGGSGIGTGTGSGLGPGEGGGSGGGIGYGTGSRGLVKDINTTINEEGQVAVEVHVMADGTVSEARVVNNAKGRTTITNTFIQQQCIREAKKAIYKPGKEELRIILFK